MATRLVFKAALLFLCLCYGTPAVSQEAIRGRMKVELQGWTASCGPSQPDAIPVCSLPSAGGYPAQEAVLQLAEVSQPGQRWMTFWDFSLPSDGTSALRGRIWIYSVIPAAKTGLPPYLQTKVELISPYRAICAQSVKWQRSDGIPPTICVVFSADSLTQYGVTARFELLEESAR